MEKEAVITLQFSTTNVLSSMMIRRLCHSRFSHVDALMADGTLLGASNSPHAPVVTGNAGGVAVRPADYEPYGIRRVARIKTTQDVHDKFWKNVKDQIGKPFDDDAIKAFLSSEVEYPRDWRKPDKWFCSEMMTWALEDAGLWPWKLLTSKNRISPADLLCYLNPFVDPDEFWAPVPGYVMGPEEV